MYCKHCGKEIDNDSSFCKHCGKTQGSNLVTNDMIPYRIVRTICSDMKWFIYSIWLIINLCCLFGEKCGYDYFYLYPRLSYSEDTFSLEYYQFTDFLVYAFLIPITVFLGHQYFQKHKSFKTRLYWGIWFAFNLLMYYISSFEDHESFFPFTLRREYNWDYPLFYIPAYDLSELVVYTMLIPIGYWGFWYYRDRKVQKK